MMRASSFLLPRTPDFYLCPIIPVGQGPPGDAQGGQEDYCPPLCTLLQVQYKLGLEMLTRLGNSNVLGCPCYVYPWNPCCLKALQKSKIESRLYTLLIYDYILVFETGLILLVVFWLTVLLRIYAPHIFLQKVIFINQEYMDNVLILFMILNKRKLFIEHYEHNVHQTNENY